MRIPITTYGLPQAAVFPAIIVVLMLICFAFAGKMPSVAIIATEIVLFVILVWVLAFFRDPRREIDIADNELLSPADGTVTDIEIVSDSPLGRPTIKIGIFLSIFNVHINRTPCAVKIDRVSYKKGQYKNAMSPDSGRLNESNDIFMTRLKEPQDTLLVRQISGAIARRIVCCATAGQHFSGGEKFGMIKFGSRTELYLPARPDAKCLVKTGDKVRAGLTKLIRYQG